MKVYRLTNEEMAAVEDAIKVAANLYRTMSDAGMVGDTGLEEEAERLERVGVFLQRAHGEGVIIETDEDE